MKPRIAPTLVDGVELWPCSLCGQRRPLADFYVSAGGHRNSRCKACMSAYRHDRWVQGIGRCGSGGAIRRAGEERYLAALERLRTAAALHGRPLPAVLIEAMNAFAEALEQAAPRAAAPPDDALCSV